MVKDIFKIVREIRDSGVTVLLIEKNAKAALEIGLITIAGVGGV